MIKTQTKRLPGFARLLALLVVVTAALTFSLSLITNSSAAIGDNITIAQARALADNSVVTIQGTVTVATRIFDDTGRTFYIQDATGGVQIYYPNNPLNLVEGDQVKVVGKITTYANHREVVPTSATKLNTTPGTPLEPVLIHSIENGAHAGQLVRIQGVIVAGSQDYFTITDSADINQGDVNAYIYGTTGIGFNAIASGQTVCVTGIADPYNADQEILPRREADISEGACTVVSKVSPFDYNIFVLSDLDLTSNGSSVQGRIGVGGNAVFNSANLGDANTADDELTVQRDLTFRDNGTTIKGNAVYGGTFKSGNVTFLKGKAIKASSAPFDIEALRTAAKAAASKWAALPNQINATSQYGGFNLVGKDASLNVFKLKGSELATANNLTINAPAGATVIVNIDGVSGDKLTNMGISLQGGIDRQHVLYNFYEATDLTIGGVSLEGTIWAANASITFNNAVVEGSLIANSISGSGQFSNFPYLGKQP